MRREYPGERFELRLENGKQEAYITSADGEETKCFPELPDDFIFPILVLHLDRGSVGAGAASFLENIEDSEMPGYLTFTFFDKFHALVRNGKNGTRMGNMCLLNLAVAFQILS